MSGEFPYGPTYRCKSTTAFPCRPDGCGGPLCYRALTPQGYPTGTNPPASNWWKWIVGGVVALIAVLVVLNNTGLLRKLADHVLGG